MFSLSDFKFNSKPYFMFEDKKEEVSSWYDKNAVARGKWTKRNKYYYTYIAELLGLIVEPNKKVLLLRSDTGDFLVAVKPCVGVGLDYSQELLNIAKKKYPQFDFIKSDFENITVDEKFDYILIVNLLDDIADVYKHFKELNKVSDGRTRIVIINHNYLWYPLLKLGEKIGLKMKQPDLNWLSPSDIKNFLYLAGFEIVKNERAVLLPKYIPLVSFIFNKVIAALPLINKLCFLQISVARKIPNSENKNYSVSVISPCKNEKGNIEGIIKRVPAMGKFTEIIIVDDKSTDGTGEEVEKFIKEFPEKNIKLFKGPGICKAQAVWEGFKHATGDVLMILDGDLTVIPEELPYFYEAIATCKGEFINGSRMTYQMEKEAMRPFNVVGNKFFSTVFSYLLGGEIRDTLCGTKVFLKSDYERMIKFFGQWGEDRWGDYELLFSACKINLKIVDMPVHYVSRIYGETKMNKRIKNGLIMLRMCWTAFKKFKYV